MKDKEQKMTRRQALGAGMVVGCLSMDFFLQKAEQSTGLPSLDEQGFSNLQRKWEEPERRKFLLARAGGLAWGVAGWFLLNK